MLTTFDLRSGMVFRGINGKPETVVTVRETASGSKNSLVIDTDKRSIIAHANDEFAIIR